MIRIQRRESQPTSSTRGEWGCFGVGEAGLWDPPRGALRDRAGFADFGRPRGESSLGVHRDRASRGSRALLTRGVAGVSWVPHERGAEGATNKPEALPDLLCGARGGYLRASR